MDWATAELGDKLDDKHFDVPCRIIAWGHHWRIRVSLHLQCSIEACMLGKYPFAADY
jgi:hypothetical protein